MMIATTALKSNRELKFFLKLTFDVKNFSQYIANKCNVTDMVKREIYRIDLWL